MKTLIEFIKESLLDNDTLSELRELNVHSPEELKKVFSILNYKEDSEEAKDGIKNLPKTIKDILKKYHYADSKEKYYSGLRALFCHVSIENKVAKRLMASKKISDVRQTSHDADRNNGYDFDSSIGTIDVKTHFYGNKNFALSSTKAQWLCFVDMDLSDVTKAKEEFSKAKLYIVNKKKLYDQINTGSPSNMSKLISLDEIKKLAEYII